MSNLLKVGALSAALLSVSFFALSAHKKDYQGGKKVPLQCHCGKFTGRVTLPVKETQQAGMNVVCHCNDCFTWASQVVQHGSLTPSQGDEVLMVYKASIELDTPELLRPMRLKQGSSTHRFMTKCCGTAVGAFVSGSPIFGLSGNLVKDRESLLNRLGDRYNIRLKDRKQSEDQFINDPNSFADVPAWFFAKYIGFAVQGLAEMSSPSPFKDDSGKAEIVFPE